MTAGQFIAFDTNRKARKMKTYLVQVGRVIDVKVDARSEHEAEALATEMCSEENFMVTQVIN